jgi:gluconate kinase
MTVAAFLAKTLGCSFIKANNYHSQANKGLKNSLSHNQPTFPFVISELLSSSLSLTTAKMSKVIHCVLNESCQKPYL